MNPDNLRVSLDGNDKVFTIDGEELCRFPNDGSILVIPVIKALRAKYGFGLVECKAIWDARVGDKFQQTVFPDRIIITRRAHDWHACIDGHSGLWGCGSSPAEAVGQVVMAHYEYFKLRPCVVADENGGTA